MHNRPRTWLSIPITLALAALCVPSCGGSSYDTEPRYCDCYENDVLTTSCETVQICWDVDDLQDMGVQGWDEGPGLMEGTISSCCGDYELLSMSVMSYGEPSEDSYETCGADFEVAEGEISVFCHNNPGKAN